MLAVSAVAQTKLNLFYSPSLRVGLIGTYQEHDLPLELTQLVSASLVQVASDGKIKPNLVTGWETSNDATQFKFKLKDNLKWSDNTKVEAADLEFAIPNTTISSPDKTIIQFNLKESYSPLPSLLTKPVFKKGGKLMGLGPYRVTKIEKSRIFITKITLKSDNPKLPAVYVRFYPNEKVAITGFNLGEVQVLLGLTSPNLPTSSITGVRSQVDYSKIVALLYQTTDTYLGNRSLRQALSYALPKLEGEQIADNPYPPHHWAYNKDAKKYLGNFEEAKLALERARSYMPDDQLNSAELILTTTPNLENMGKMAVAAWKKLGFNAKIRVESGIPQNFQALLITQSIPQDPDQYFLWHATQEKTNLTKYDSKRVDKDLEDGRKIIVEDDRKAKYFDFQKTLLEDAPAAFLYFPKSNIVYLKKIEPLLKEVYAWAFR